MIDLIQPKIAYELSDRTVVIIRPPHGGPLGDVK